MRKSILRPLAALLVLLTVALSVTVIGMAGETPAATGAIRLHNVADGELPEGTNFPTSYTVGEPNTFILPTPVRDNAVFAGWYDNAQMEGEPVSAVVITEDTTGDLHYYAKWGKVFIREEFATGVGVFAFTGKDTSTAVPNADGVLLFNKNPNTALALNDAFFEAKLSPKAETSRRMTVEIKLGLPAGKTEATTGNLRLRPSGTAYECSLLGIAKDGTVSVGGVAIGALTDTMQAFALDLIYGVPGSDGLTPVTVLCYVDGKMVATCEINTRLAWEEIARINLYSGNNQSAQLLIDDFAVSTGGGFVFTQPVGAKVTLQTNGGTVAVGEEIVSYTYGEAVSLPAPTRAGFVFGGWYTNPAFTGARVETIAAYERGARIFYAKWLTPVTVTVEKSGEAPATTDTYIGEFFTLPTLSAGFAWVNSFDGIDYYYTSGATVSVKGDQTFRETAVVGKVTDGAYVVLNKGFASDNAAELTSGGLSLNAVAASSTVTNGYARFALNDKAAFVYKMKAADDENTAFVVSFSVMKEAGIAFPRLFFRVQGDGRAENLFCFDAAGKILAGDGTEIGALADGIFTNVQVVYDLSVGSYGIYLDGVMKYVGEILCAEGITEYFCFYASKANAGTVVCMDDLTVTSGAKSPLLSEMTAGLVDYVVGKGVLPAGTTNVYTYGAACTLPTPTRPGASFFGWYTAPDFSGTAVAEIPADAEGHVTYYAKWQVNLTFDTVAAPHFEGVITLPNAGEGKAWSVTEGGVLYYYPSEGTYTVTEGVDFVSVDAALYDNYKRFAEQLAALEGASTYAAIHYAITTIEELAAGMPVNMYGLAEAQVKLAEAKEKLDAISAEIRAYVARVDALAAIMNLQERQREVLAISEIVIDETAEAGAAAKLRFEEAASALNDLFKKITIYIEDAAKIDAALLKTDLTYADLYEYIERAERYGIEVLPYREQYADKLPAAEQSVIAGRAKLTEWEQSAAPFITKVGEIDLDADKDTLRAQYEAAKAVLFTGDTTIPGVTGALYTYRMADAAVNAHNIIAEAFGNAANLIDMNAPYAELLAQVETTEMLGELVDPATPGVADTLALIGDARAILAAKQSVAERYLAEYVKLSGAATWGERKAIVDALAAISPDETYPAVKEALAAAELEREVLEKAEENAADFVRAVDAYLAAASMKEKHTAYAKLYALMSAEGYDATISVNVTALAKLEPEVAAYEQKVEEVNHTVAYSFDVVAVAAVAMSDVRMTPVYATMADIRPKTKED